MIGSASQAPGDSGSVDAGQGFCTDASFCDEFERPNDPQGMWGLLDVATDHVTMTTDRPHDGAYLLRFDVAASTATKHAYLRKTLPRGQSQKVSVDVRYRPPVSFGTDGTHTDLVYVAFSGAAVTDSALLVGLFMTNAGVYLTAQSGSDPYASVSPISHRQGDWNEVTLKVDLGAGKAVMNLDGQSSASTLEVHPGAGIAESVDVFLGPVYGDQHGAFVLDVDAVRVDLVH